MAKRVATARKAPAVGKDVRGDAGTDKSVCAEPVEAPSWSSSDQQKAGQCFDELSTGGDTKRDAKGRFLPRSAAAAGPVTRPAKPSRWTARAEAVFLDALADCGCVAKAARAAGLSDTTVYRQRRRSDAFRARWAEALREGFAKLETEVLDRALNGTEKAIFHAGKKVAVVRTFNDRLALQLLNAHRGAVHGPSGVANTVTDAMLRQLVCDRLSEINRRMGGKG